MTRDVATAAAPKSGYAARVRPRPLARITHATWVWPPTLPQSRTSSTPVAVPPSSRRRRLRRGAAVSASADDRAGVAAIGQSGQRRTFAQHGPSGLRAVAGAASATSAAAGSPPRKRTPRRRRRRPRPGQGNVALALAGPAMPDGTRAIEGHPRPHARACVWRPSARPEDVASLRLVARRWPVLRNRGGRPAARGSRPPRAMIARGRAGAPRRVRATAQARRASRQARP